MTQYTEVTEVPSEGFPGKADVEDVYRQLVNKGVQGFRMYFHPAVAVSSAPSHLDVYGGTEAEILKCLVVADGKDPQKPVCCVLMSAEYKWDRQKMKALTGFRDPTMASDAQLRKWTGRGSGGLDPFSIPPDLRAWIEQRLIDKPWVVGSCGSPHMGLGVSPAEILRVTGYEVVDVGKDG